MAKVLRIVITTTFLTLTSCMMTISTKKASWSAETNSIELINKPKIQSNVTSLNIGVNGPSVTTYKYKVSSSTSGINCQSDSDYSDAVNISTHITDSIQSWADGDITLCVWVGNSKNQFTSVEQAISYVWTKDTTPPTKPTLVKHSDPIGSPSATTLPSFEVQGLTAGETVKLFSDSSCSTEAGRAVLSDQYESTSAIIPLSSNIAVDGLYKYYANATDFAGNVSGCSTSFVSYVLSRSAISAILTGAPTGTSNITSSLDIAVSGNNIAYYKYKFIEYPYVNDCDDSSGYSTIISVGTHITQNISGLADGSIKLCVVGKTNLGVWQDYFAATTASWTKDTTAPTATLSGTPANPSNSVALNINVGGTEVVSYSYKVGASTTTICTDPVGYSSSIAESVNITDTISGIADGNITLCVLGIDASNNVQSISSSTSLTWVKDTIAPVSALSGTPTSPSNATSLNIAVTGASYYSYKLGAAADCANATGYSGAITIGTPITDSLTAFSDGSLTICVIGRDAAGNWQSYSSATSYTWTKDTTAPTSPTISINANATYTNSTSSTLTVSAVAATEMLISSSSDCSTGSWVSYSTSASYTLPSTNTTTYAYIKFRDLANNQTSCISDSIIHDNTNPASISTLSYSASSMNSLTTSPLVTWSSSSDTNPFTYEIAMGTSAGATDTVNWTDVNTSTSYTFTGLSLTNTTNYYVSVRAKDSAGNYSATKQGAAWATAYIPPPTLTASTLSTYRSVRKTITSTELQASSSGYSDKQLIYTLITLPTKGTLYLNERPLSVSDTFTQSHINGNALRFAHNGTLATTDSFTLTVTNGATPSSNQTISINITQADYIVTSISDTAHDSSAGDGVCNDGTGTCTLRAAIEEANASTGNKTIWLQAGSYLLNSASGYRELPITKGVRIIGEDPKNTIISYKNSSIAYNIFSLNTTGSVYFYNLTISEAQDSLIHGQNTNSTSLYLVNSILSRGATSTAGEGSAINILSGAINIADSLIFGNTTGELVVVGTGNITISNSVFLKNSSQRLVETSSGTMTITSSSFTENNSRILSILGSGSSLVQNSTFANNYYTNTAGTSQAVIASGASATLTVKSSTFTKNNNMSIFYLANANTTIINDLFFANTVSYSSSRLCDSNSTQNFLSNNYIVTELTTDGTCTLNTSNNLTNFSSSNLYMTSDFNGGLTRTVKMDSNSLGVNAAQSSQCPDLDQRGILRDSSCDVGAYEYTTGTPPSLLTYNRSWFAWITSVAMPDLTPSVSGSGLTFSISPNLPSGLSLDTNTGKISGTPTSRIPATPYKITASNTSGSTSTILELRIGLGFLVNSTADDVDSNIGDGVCLTAVSTCTLRAAFTEANANAGGRDENIIIIPEGTITLTSALPDYTANASVALIGTNRTTSIITRSGSNFPGPKFYTTTASPLSSVSVSDLTFSAFANTFNGSGLLFYGYNPFKISQTTFQNGTSPTASLNGAIYFSPTGTAYIQGLVEYSRFYNNVGGTGGSGISTVTSKARLTIRFSEFESNTSTSGAALAALSSSQIEVYDSLFKNNLATSPLSYGGGGAAQAKDNSVITFYNSTFYGNSSNNYAGLASAYSSASTEDPIIKFFNCTVVNSSSSSGATDKGVIRIYSTTAGKGHVYLYNSIFLNNTDSSELGLCSNYNGNGVFEANHSNSFDFSTSTETSCGHGSTDITGNATNILVSGAPTNNGGYLNTIALHASSNLYNFGDYFYCGANDARGYPRKSKSLSPTSAVSSCDIGAYQSQ